MTVVIPIKDSPPLTIEDDGFVYERVPIALGGASSKRHKMRLEEVLKNSRGEPMGAILRVLDRNSTVRFLYARGGVRRATPQYIRKFKEAMK